KTGTTARRERACGARPVRPHGSFVVRRGTTRLHRGGGTGMTDERQIEIRCGPLSRTFAGPTVRIGRAQDNDVVVLNPHVSRHHAEVRDDGSTWEVVDLGSTQGTWVGGTRVARHVVDGATD